jgi:hypothetical protein
MPVGVAATLRSDRGYEFLDRLVSIAIPRIRDFRGLNPRSFDGRGNYSMGVKEQIIFPEIDYDSIDQVRGMDITITTSAATDAEAYALLSALGMPFATQGRPAGFDLPGDEPELEPEPEAPAPAAAKPAAAEPEATEAEAAEPDAEEAEAEAPEAGVAEAAVAEPEAPETEAAEAEPEAAEPEAEEPEAAARETDEAPTAEQDGAGGDPENGGPQTTEKESTD